MSIAPKGVFCYLFWIQVILIKKNANIILKRQIYRRISKYTIRDGIERKMLWNKSM